MPTVRARLPPRFPRPAHKHRQIWEQILQRAQGAYCPARRRPSRRHHQGSATGHTTREARVLRSVKERGAPGVGAVKGRSMEAGLVSCSLQGSAIKRTTDSSRCEWVRGGMASKCVAYVLRVVVGVFLRCVENDESRFQNNAKRLGCIFAASSSRAYAAARCACAGACPVLHACTGLCGTSSTCRKRQAPSIHCRLPQGFPCTSQKVRIVSKIVRLCFGPAHTKPRGLQQFDQNAKWFGSKLQYRWLSASQPQRGFSEDAQNRIIHNGLRVLPRCVPPQVACIHLRQHDKHEIRARCTVESRDK